MHARVVRWQVDDEQRERSKQIWNEVMNDAGAVQGFCGGYLLGAGDDDRVMSVTLWESEDDMLRTEQSGWWQQQVDRFRGVMRGAPVREHYAVEATPSERPRRGAPEMAAQPGA